MQPNISINISGIIFHIENEAYEKLRKYLDSINAYFSGYEDSDEIVDDIEMRIAENFLKKLDDQKQVITSEDVDSLITVMGTTADFEVENSDGDDQKETEQPHKRHHKSGQQDKSDDRELRRNKHDSILGGVASGIGNYWRVDVQWVRLAFVLIFFGAFFNETAFLIVAVYVLLWLVIPVSEDMQEDAGVRKLYRDQKHRVLSGVASGVAAYFRMDITLIRILFVLFALVTGIGLLVYLVLWMVTPSAESVTEQMQMHGRQVTLTNIEQSIDQNLRKEPLKEGAVTSILLFPFRAVALVFGAIVKLLGPVSMLIIHFIRVLVGVMLLTSSLAAITVLTLVVIEFTGYLDYYQISSVFPYDGLVQYVNTVNPWWIVPFYLASVIPPFMMGALGITALRQRMVFGQTFWVSLFVSWVLATMLSVIVLRVILPQFREYGESREVIDYQLVVQPLSLKMNPADSDMIALGSVRLTSHADSVVSLELIRSARGSDDESVMENIKDIAFDSDYREGNLVIDGGFSLPVQADYRQRGLDLVIYLPTGISFSMDEKFSRLIYPSLSQYGVPEDLVSRTQILWAFDSTGLRCQSCEDMDYFVVDQADYSQYDFKEFSSLSVKGAGAKVYIRQDTIFSVKFKRSEGQHDHGKIYQEGEMLVVDNDAEGWFDIEKILGGDNSYEKLPPLIITLPDLERLEVSDMRNVNLGDFENQRMSMKVSGFASVSGNIRCEELVLRQSDFSALNLSGTIKYFNSRNSDMTTLNAQKLSCEEAELRLSDMAKVNVSVTHRISGFASDMSQITYIGHPDAKGISTSDMASVRKQ